MIAEVVVDISNDSVDRVYDYFALPTTQVGMRVRVPFANRLVLGYVLKLKDDTDFDKSKLKSIKENLDDLPLIKPELVELTDFMSSRFFLRKADIFKLILPASIRNDTVKDKTYEVIKFTGDLAEILPSMNKNAKSQIAALNYLNEKGEEVRSKLAEKFGASAVKGLIEKGLVSIDIVKLNRTPSAEVLSDKRVKLNKGQQYAVDTILNSADTYLLKGVTGSGKTEVYMNVIEEQLSKGKTAIMLVPEISLTPQMLNRFTSRFPGIVAVLHSGLSDGEKFDEWQRIFKGEAKVVLGARSAIFAPVENLGVVIIDEEHDNSYVSESNPRYITEDVAIWRGKFNNAPVILGSATPKIESYQKAHNGEFKLIELNERVNNLEMPCIQVVDMLNEVLDGNTSPYSRLLIAKLKECVDNGKQAILFINRRGYASFMMCRECGYIAKCDDCAVSLVYHSNEEELKCHFCGKRYRALRNCPNCKSDSIKYGALGTQRVVNELQEIFPNIPIFRMDNDTTRQKDGHKKILMQFGQTSPSILVGTQMIAKGHDYPNVAFVGILDADVSLYTSDYRSTERTFQLVTQVAGRTGRKNNDGFVVLQTYAPKHYVYRFASQYEYVGFYNKEINLRQTTMFPPFSHILRILVSSEDEQRCIQTTKKIYDRALKLKEKYGTMFMFLQAMPAPVKRIQRKFRYQILMRVGLDDNLVSDIYNIADIIEKDVSIFIEHNPNNLR